MAIESRIYQTLTTSITLTGLTTGIYPIKRPQDAALPAITYQRQGGERLYSLQGYVTLENPSYEFTIHSTGLDNLRVLGDALLGALSSAADFKAIPLNSPTDEWDDGTDIYTRIYDVSIWNAE